MKRATKNVLGAIGLSAVAATTIFAATLPSPTASAVSSVTDTLQVRVVGSTPSVTLTSDYGSSTVIARFPFMATYENLESLKITLNYKVSEGVVREVELENYTLDYEAGEIEVVLDLTDDGVDGFGYGEYWIEAVGTGYEGVKTNPFILNFSYVPGKIDNTNKDNPVLSIDTRDGEVKWADLKVYGPAPSTSEIESRRMTDVEIPESGKVSVSKLVEGLDVGVYEIEITAYSAEDADGERTLIYQNRFTYVVTERPDAGGDVPGGPDTGGLFRNLDISRADYVVTALLVFFVFAVVGVGVILRSRKAPAKISSKSSAKSRRKR